MNVSTIILREWGRRPHRSITLALFPSLSWLSLPLSLPPLSNTPTRSLTPLLLHWPMFNCCFPTCHWPVWDSLPPNLLDQAVRHITGRSLSTLWSKLFTASSTWWTISQHDPILLFYSKQRASWHFDSYAMHVSIATHLYAFQHSCNINIIAIFMIKTAQIINQWALLVIQSLQMFLCKWK